MAGGGREGRVEGGDAGGSHGLRHPKEIIRNEHADSDMQRKIIENGHVSKDVKRKSPEMST